MKQSCLRHQGYNNTSIQLCKHTCEELDGYGHDEQCNWKFYPDEYDSEDINFDCNMTWGNKISQNMVYCLAY